VRLGVCVLVSIIVAGCGARASRLPAELPPAADALSAYKVAQPATSAPAAAAAPATWTFAEFMAKARAAAAEARPPARASIERLEAADPRLATALLAAKVAPSPQTLRHVAEEYLRLGIFDQAHDYLHRALTLDPRDGATYDALARRWRDGGFFDAALADAQRALYYAPNSAAVHNTLGTVFQALGRRAQARQQYARALELDPKADYALNNLCYGWILDREPLKAVTACEAALKLNPGLAAARNNLGLAFAARGDLNASRGAFERVGDRATALYNLGIVHMARREYSDAVTAFAAAQQARPLFRMATTRAEQAGKLALAGDD
jgi:Flp pilus assembly protein TadD